MLLHAIQAVYSMFNLGCFCIPLFVVVVLIVFFCLFVFLSHPHIHHPPFPLANPNPFHPIRQSMQYVSMKILYKTTLGTFIWNLFSVEYFPKLKLCFLRLAS